MSELDLLSLQPGDCICSISGQYFKIGRFNRVFVYRMGEWVVTRCTAIKAVHKAIDQQLHDRKEIITEPAERRQHVTHAAKDLLIAPCLSKKSAMVARKEVIRKAKNRTLVSRSLV